MLLSQLSHLRFRNCLNQGANVATVTSRVKLIKAKPTDFDIVTEYTDNIFCHQSLFEILIKKMPARITSWLVGCPTIQLYNCLSFRTGHSVNNDTKHSSVPSDAKQVFVQLKTKLRIAQRIEGIALVYCLRHCRQHCSQTNRELSTEKPMYSILESSHLVCRLERGFFPANQWSKDFLIHGYMIVSLINGFDRHHICAYYHCTMR